MPNNLANATAPMDTTGMNVVPFPAAPAAPPSQSADPEFSPISLAPIPPVMGTDTDAARQFYRTGVSQLRMPPLPAAAKIAIGASAASQVLAGQVESGSILLKTNNANNPVQDILNLTGTGVSYGPNPGEVQFVAGETDGLIHRQGGGGVDSGSWESDPAYVVMRDDFFSAGTTGSNGTIVVTGTTKIGDLGWIIGSPQGNDFSSVLGAPPNLGTFCFDDKGSQNTAGVIVLTAGSAFNTSGNFSNDCLMALLEYPNWKASFVWKTDFSVAGTRQHTTAKKAMYIGFISGDYYGSLNTTLSSRPNTFMGIRFDTSTSPGTLSVTAVAASVSGAAAYTITSNSLGTSNGFAGTTFVVTGCAASNNNGTFFCIASSSTSITLENGSATLASAQTASAAGPTPPNDSFYTFEVVNNLSNPSLTAYGRCNKQGQTSVTTVAPAAGVWHRLDIECTAVGIVTMTLDGSSSNTATFTVPVQTLTLTNTISQATVSNGSVQVSWPSSAASTLAGGYAHKWGAGSLVTLTGFSSAYNGTFPLNRVTGPTTILMNNASGSGTSSPTSATLSGYPAWMPTFWFGDDDTASPTGNSICFCIDLFTFIWNPGVGGGTGTPLITNPRYFPSTTD